MTTPRSRCITKDSLKYRPKNLSGTYYSLTDIWVRSGWIRCRQSWAKSILMDDYIAWLYGIFYHFQARDWDGAKQNGSKFASKQFSRLLFTSYFHRTHANPFNRLFILHAVRGVAISILVVQLPLTLPVMLPWVWAHRIRTGAMLCCVYDANEKPQMTFFHSNDQQDPLEIHSLTFVKRNHSFYLISYWKPTPSAWHAIVVRFFFFFWFNL